MIIKFTYKGYNELRNFLNTEKVIFIQTIDLFKVYTFLCFKVYNYIPKWTQNSFFNPFLSKNTILHFFNGVNFGNNKWVSTFETRIPRHGENAFLENLAIKSLAKTSCLAIISMSKSSYSLQKKYLKSYYPENAKTIISKMIVLHPPQVLLVDSSIKAVDLGLVFTFVGNEFFRKGGREILAVFKDLHEKGYDFCLNIISNLSPDEYASKTTSIDVNALKIELNNLPSSIKFLGTVPNEQVIKLLKDSHVALLPTYADTYGYFVLEAQACGCPVITTDIRALPEINNESCGWLIAVPKDENGNGLLRNSMERTQFSQIVKKELHEIVKNILGDPMIVSSKGEAALTRIKKDHDPNKHSQRLLSIYREISIEKP
jgi:glycosyltransferase involved in cell wall biosynthesis